MTVTDLRSAGLNLLTVYELQLFLAVAASVCSFYENCADTQENKNQAEVSEGEQRRF